MKPGIYAHSAAAYHADELGCDAPMLSASIATILLRESPKHAYAAHPLLGGGVQAESEIFDLGTAVHSLLLEGSEACFALVEAENWRTKLAKEARDAARKAGKIPLLSHHIENVRTMATAVRAQLDAFTDKPAPLTAGKPEQVLIWHEPDHDIWCKARLDWLHDDYSTIDDLKSGARSGNPNAWARTLYGRGGDLQPAMYIRGVKALTGIEPDFRFIVAENEYPFATSVIGLTPEGLAHASDQCEQAIQKWAACLKSGNWPGYPTRTCYIDPPAWAIASYMEQGDDEAAPARGLASTGWERA